MLLTKVSIPFNSRYCYFTCPYCHCYDSDTQVIRRYEGKWQAWWCPDCGRDWLLRENWLDDAINIENRKDGMYAVDVYLFDYPCNDEVLGDYYLKESNYVESR